MSMLALTKEHLSDRQQEELKRLVFQKLKTDSSAYYRGKQIGDDYYQIVISNRTELVYRFRWRQVVDLMPWPNFPIKYMFHCKIRTADVRLIQQRTIEKKASPGDCAREVEARLPINDTEEEALYFDGQRFLAMANSAHEFVKQVGSVLGAPSNVVTLMEHRSNDEHLLKMSFEVNIQPRILNGQFLARNGRFLLRLWDEQDTPPKFSELQLTNINSDLGELRYQLQVCARLYSFRGRIASAICQTYNLAESGEVSAPYVIGDWRSAVVELTLKMDISKEVVAVAITLNQDERCILLSEEFTDQKQMLDFIRSRLNFCEVELKEFRRTLMGYFSEISSRVVQVGRPMKSTGNVVLFDEIMVMGAFSDPFFLRFSYNFSTSLYECRSSMGAIEALTADEIGSMVSEHVDHYLIFDRECVPMRLRDTLVTVKKKAKLNSESLLTIKQELRSFDMLYLADIKITQRGMYLDHQVTVPKCSGSSTSFESIPLNEFLHGNSKLLIVRSQKLTAEEESSIRSRLSDKVLTLDPEVAMNTLRWQISRQLSLVFYSKLQTVYE